MFEGYDPIWTDWHRVILLYRSHRDWEASRFPGSWRHDVYVRRVEMIEKLISISAFEWSPEELECMERYGAIGEVFWYKKLGKKL